VVELGPKLQAALSGTYTIERELGRGGMATVFLAQDLKHHRQVAMKVLRPEIANAIGAERFLREIETEAQLNHPHILPLFDSGEADGLLYYVMPYVEGESLQDRLDREKQLPLEDALRITRNVAAALAHAHSLGIIHRDIKPGNIMLEGDEAVVADFGIARAVTSAGGEHLTETGITLGTPAYMSPEQAGGEGTIDGRSDVYALGCVLFEMLAGEPPFTGPTAQAIIARHMREEPRSLSVVRPTVPASVEYAVGKALAKVPADRPLTAERFVELFEAPVPAGMERDRRAVPRWLPVLVGTVVVAAATGIGLWRIAAIGETPAGGVTPAEAFDQTRIAVLYFDDFSAGRELGYLANGLTEAVIHELSQVPALQIISRNGVRPYRDTPVTLDSIARALRVGTLIEGSVTRSGQLLRVTAQIIETAGMTHLASRSLDRPWGDWLAIVDETVGVISGEFREELGVEILQQERRARSTNPQAWELLHRAEQLREDHRALWMDGDTLAAERTLMRADSLLTIAVSLDPDWVEPVLHRGFVAGDLAALLGPTPGVYDQTWITRGLQFASKALERDEEDPEALELRGTLRYRSFLASESVDLDLLVAAERDLRAAVQANPRLASAWATLSELLQEAKGEFGEAKQAAMRAYEEDAFLAEAKNILIRLSNTALELNQFDEVVLWAEQGRQRFPDAVDFPAVELGSLSHGGSPDVRQAWELVEEIERLTSPQHRALYGSIVRMQVAAVLARAGAEDSAKAVIQRTRSQAPEDPEQYIAYDEAHAWLHLGERDEALRALGMYLEAKPQDKSYIPQDPWFQELRDDPRFKQLTGPGG
jgi:serine/threonine-protein kinase